MSSKRRRFSGELKAKVALEALRGDRTLQEIASQHQVHPNQVSVPTIGAGLVAVARRHLEVVAAGEGEDHLVRAGPHRRLDHRFRVGLGRQAGDVLRHRALEQHHLLGQPAQMARKVRLAVLVERRAAERRLAAHRRPHPGERLGERRLARGRRPGDPDGMAGIEAAIMIPGVTSPRIASQAPSPSIIDCRNSLSVREVKVGAGIIALFLAWFWYRGVQLGRRKRIRGAELVTAAELRRRVRPLHLRALDRAPGGKRLRPYSIAGIPYPERTATLAWVEKNVAETRMKDPATGQMVRAGGQKIVAATFRHDTSRNLDPQLHTHAVLANMVRGEDDKWRSMANEKLYGSKMLLGALYRSELAASLTRLGYDIEKTHADGRFEIAGVSRGTIEAFSTRRAEIEAAMAERGLGTSGDNPRLAERASLMTRAKKRDIDRSELRGVWERQAADLGLDARALVAGAAGKSSEPIPEAAPAAAEPATEPDKARETAAPVFASERLTGALLDRIVRRQIKWANRVGLVAEALALSD